MRVFVVAGSPVAEQPWHVHPGPSDRVIAADLGAAHALRWGWPVHLLIGDLDSLPEGRARDLSRGGTPVERAPVAKNETDTELALARALEFGPDQVILCAAVGGRTDHFLANVLLLARPGLAATDVIIADGGQTLRLAQSGRGAVDVEIEGAAGDLVSLLPLAGDVTGVTTDGLLYPLHAETLYLGAARGVSNVLTGPRGRVTLERGQLLVIHLRMEKR